MWMSRIRGSPSWIPFPVWQNKFFFSSEDVVSPMARTRGTVYDDTWFNTRQHQFRNQNSVALYLKLRTLNVKVPISIPGSPAGTPRGLPVGYPSHYCHLNEIQTYNLGGPTVSRVGVDKVVPGSVPVSFSLTFVYLHVYFLMRIIGWNQVHC